MFWLGVLVGVFVGANMGVVIAALLISIEKEEVYEHVAERGN